MGLADSRAKIGKHQAHSWVCLPQQFQKTEHHTPRSSRPRRGKAPLVDPFTGEAPDVWLEDWLMALERAAAWNQWLEDDQLSQLAGHLQGRVLQEWDLLEATEKVTYSRAVESHRAKLDPGSKAVAAQEFCHTSQINGAYFICLEKLFWFTYRRDKLSTETLLYGKLQEGLCYDLVHAPAMSGSQTYTKLCFCQEQGVETGSTEPEEAVQPVRPCCRHNALTF